MNKNRGAKKVLSIHSSCPICGGSGFVLLENKKIKADETKTCETCEGFGIIESEENNQ